MKKILILVLIALLAGCSGNSQVHNVADVTKSETILLKNVSSQPDIYGMVVIGKGHIDGTAEIVLMLNGKPYKTETLSEDVSFRWSGDWYNDSATIEYKPLSVRSGNLSLEYEFKNIGVN